MLPLALLLATQTCPHGDGPAELGTYTHARRELRLHVEDGAARLVVDDVLENSGPGPAEYEGSLDLVDDLAFVSGGELVVEGRPRTVAMLDDPGDAAASFNDFVHALVVGVAPEEAGQGAPAPALLVGHGEQSVGLRVAGPCSIRTVTARITATMTSIPVDGAWRFLLPTVEEDVPTTIVITSDRLIQTRLDDEILYPDQVASLAFLDGGHFVDVMPLERPALRARAIAARITPIAPLRGAAAVDASEDAGAEARATDQAKERAEPVPDVTLLRAELDLPRPLADAPAGLRLVFVLDASVSVRDGGVAKQWHLIDQILDAAPPDARYAVIAASRKPSVVVAPWRQRADRERPVVETQNGSDIRRALKLAQGIASDVRNDEDLVEVSRIVVLSDMELKLADDDARVARSFKGPLTHVIGLGEGLDPRIPLAWSRAYGEDDPRVAGLEKTGGIWVNTGWGDDEEATLAPHLIAPTRVDRPRVLMGDGDVLADPTAVDITLSPRDEGVPTNQHELPEYLNAGSGVRLNVALTRDAGPVRITGLLWSTPLDVTVAPLPRSMLALAANDDVGDTLDPSIIRSVGVDAHAVTSETSLLAVPKWRPASDGLAGFGMSGCGCCCGCCGGISGFGTRCSIGGSADLQEEETLARLLAEDARACGQKRATVEVEFWDLEILDVAGVHASRCVVERMWRRRLDKLADRIPGAFAGHRRIQVESTSDPG